MLKLKTVPCIVADDLTDEQIKAFRLADNKTAELAEWDFDLIEKELADIDFDMSLFGFETLDFGHIDDLLNNDEISYEQKEKDTFNITFVFSKENEDEILDYIKENGKEAIVQVITDMATGAIPWG